MTMVEKDFNKLREKIEALNQQKAKAQGVIEQILASWQGENIASLEDAEKELAVLDEEITKTDQTIDRTYQELQGLVNGIA